MSKDRRRRGGAGRRWLVFLTCTLAVPTIAQVMGIYGPDMDPQALRAPLAVGALLGVCHIVLRPVLRFVFAPVGCLTFGLFGLVIDIGLIYLCASRVPGFVVPSFLYALLCAMAINTICAVAAGRR